MEKRQIIFESLLLNTFVGFFYVLLIYSGINKRLLQVIYIDYGHETK